MEERYFGCRYENRVDGKVVNNVQVWDTETGEAVGEFEEGSDKIPTDIFVFSDENNFKRCMMLRIDRARRATTKLYTKE